MKPVRFISDVPALTYDSKNDRVIKIVRSVDTKGRRWESYNDGPPVLLESPPEPPKRKLR